MMGISASGEIVGLVGLGHFHHSSSASVGVGAVSGGCRGGTGVGVVVGGDVGAGLVQPPIIKLRVRTNTN